MRDKFIAPEVRSSFRRDTMNFISRSAGGFISCPPYVIASVASRRLAPDAQIELPEGYDEAVLSTIRAHTGWVDRDVRVSFRQAAELAMIGFTIQDLNSEGKIEPPLGPYEEQSIHHLLGQVCMLNFDGMDDPGLSNADLAYIRATQLTIDRCKS